MKVQINNQKKENCLKIISNNQVKNKKVYELVQKKNKE
jgi:hypothetical protein